MTPEPDRTRDKPGETVSVNLTRGELTAAAIATEMARLKQTLRPQRWEAVAEAERKLFDALRSRGWDRQMHLRADLAAARERIKELEGQRDEDVQAVARLVAERDGAIKDRDWARVRFHDVLAERDEALRERDQAREQAERFRVERDEWREEARSTKRSS